MKKKKRGKRNEEMSKRNRIEAKKKDEKIKEEIEKEKKENERSTRSQPSASENFQKRPEPREILYVENVCIKISTVHT